MEAKNQADKPVADAMPVDDVEQVSPTGNTKGLWDAPAVTRLSGNETESKITGGFEAGSFGPMS